MGSPVNRRTFLQRTASGLAIPASVAGLFSACTDSDLVAPPGQSLANNGLGNGGYGPLSNDQGILLLPEGFRMRAFGAIGDPMSDGSPTPIALDGMAAFPHGSGRVRLVRNHEDRNDPPGRPSAPSPTTRWPERGRPRSRSAPTASCWPAG
jgi:hypothetical protein